MTVIRDRCSEKDSAVRVLQHLVRPGRHWFVTARSRHRRNETRNDEIDAVFADETDQFICRIPRIGQILDFQRSTGFLGILNFGVERAAFVRTKLDHVDADISIENRQHPVEQVAGLWKAVI